MIIRHSNCLSPLYILAVDIVYIVEIDMKFVTVQQMTVFSQKHMCRLRQSSPWAQRGHRAPPPQDPP